MQDLFKSRTVLRGKFFPLFFLFLLVFSSLVAAQPFSPVQSSDPLTSLEIVYPKNEYFNVNDDIQLHFHVFNSTGYLINPNNISCLVQVYSSKNRHLIQRNATVDSNNMESYINISTDDLRGTGVYPYIIQCVNGDEAGYVSTSFEVTIDGKDDSYNTILKLFFVFLAGAGLFIIGRVFKDYTTGIFGGLMIFLLGLYILINPMSGFAYWLNLVIGMITFAWGAYIWIVGTLEAIDLR